MQGAKAARGGEKKAVGGVKANEVTPLQVRGDDLHDDSGLVQQRRRARGEAGEGDDDAAATAVSGEIGAKDGSSNEEEDGVDLTGT
jgi:hypothetical protein